MEIGIRIEEIIPTVRFRVYTKKSFKGMPKRSLSEKSASRGRPKLGVETGRGAPPQKAADNEDAELEDFLFGKDILSDRKGTKTTRRGHDSDSGSDSDSADEVTFTIDNGAARSEEADAAEGSDLEDDTTGAHMKVAWVDDDDDKIEIDLSATNRLKKLRTVDQIDLHDTAVISGTAASELLKERFQANTLDWAQIDGNLDQAGKGGNSLLEQRGLDLDDLELLRDSRALVGGANGIAAGQGKRRTRKYRKEVGTTIGAVGTSSNDGRFATSGLMANTPLDAGRIDMQRLVNANVAEPAGSGGGSRITSVQFHTCARGDLLLAAGLDKFLRFFHIDGDRNEKQLSVRVADMPVHDARFLGNSAEVVVTGRRPYFYLYDTEHGAFSKVMAPPGWQREMKSLEHVAVSPLGSKLAFRGIGGYVHICGGVGAGGSGGGGGGHSSNGRGQWLTEVKMNTAARAIAFLDETHLVTSGLDADIYVWDLRKAGRCLARFRHEDGSCTSHLSTYTPASALALAAAGEADGTGLYRLPQALLAVGTESGVVSVFGEQPSKAPVSQNGVFSFDRWNFGTYPQSQNGSAQPSPLKTVMNLTTKITSSVFHPSGQILAIASAEVFTRHVLSSVLYRTTTVFFIVVLSSFYCVYIYIYL